MNLLKKLYHQKFTCSLTICVVIGLIVSLICEFRFGYYTNDDYQIAFLIANGEKYDLFLNYFLSSFLVFFQKIFPFNCFVVFQQLLCFVSSTAIVYVFLNKFKTALGFLISSIISLYIFVSDILLVQFSQTPVVACSAGVILLAYAGYYEKRRIIKIFQIFLSFILILFSSWIRFDSFKVCGIFVAIFTICILCLQFRKIENFSQTKKRLLKTIKESTVFLLAVSISFMISVGFLFTSDLIKQNNPNYKDYVSYNTARSRVADYPTIPYEGNEDFYNSLDIYSQSQLSLFLFDNDIYDTETLNKIADQSEHVIQDGDSKPIYALKKTIKRVIRTTKDIYGNVLSVRDQLQLPINNKLFLLLVLLLLFAFVLSFFFIKNKIVKRQNSLCKYKVFKNILCIIIIIAWYIFFKSYHLNGQNFLFMSLFSLVLFTLFLDVKENYLACILFTLFSIALFLYQYNFRISYRVSFTFLFPSIVFLLFLIELPKLKLESKSIFKIITSSFFLINLFLSTFLCFRYFYPQNTLNYDMKLREWIEENKNNTFIVRTPTNACIDNGYYNSLLVPNVPENEIFIGWSSSSNCFEDALRDKKIDNVFLDLINSDMRIIIAANVINDLYEQKSLYEEFYNHTYFNGIDTVKLKLEEKFEYNVKCDNFEENIQYVGIYKVVN